MGPRFLRYASAGAIGTAAHFATTREARVSVSIVVPVFDEAAVLRAFHQRLEPVLDGLDAEVEVLYVDDGSRDDTRLVLEALRDEDPRVAVVELSRNFGKEVAMSAGLDLAAADAIVVIDAD